jgi:hypothetical protein
MPSNWSSSGADRQSAALTASPLHLANCAAPATVDGLTAQGALVSADCDTSRIALMIPHVSVMAPPIRSGRKCVADASHFAVHVLSSAQEHLARQFSTLAQNKFADVGGGEDDESSGQLWLAAWRRPIGGLPVKRESRRTRAVGFRR